MPFKSKAQRRKFYAMASRGEMSPKTVRKWETETVGPLPERLSKTSMIMDAFADELEKVSGAVTERAPAAGAVLGGAGGAFLGAKGGPRALAGKGVAGAVGGTLLGLLLRHGGRKGEAEPS